MSSAAPTATIRVLIVEDHRVVAEGLRMVLGQHADLVVTAVTRTIEEAALAAAASPPDVALIDYHLPDGTGATAALRIRALAPDAALLVLTADTSDEAMLACIEAGVVGYVVKSEEAAHIASAIRRAAAGEMLIPGSTLAGLLARQSRPGRATDAPTLERLTPREREVLRLMAAGVDNRAIASRLGITLSTARVHVQNVLEKLDAHSKLEAVLRANRQGLIDLT